VFAGGSAGSYGASWNLDSIADMLESYGTGIKTVGLLDSSVYYEYTQYYLYDEFKPHTTNSSEIA